MKAKRGSHTLAATELPMTEKCGLKGKVKRHKFTKVSRLCDKIKREPSVNCFSKVWIKGMAEMRWQFKYTLHTFGPGASSKEKCECGKLPAGSEFSECFPSYPKLQRILSRFTLSSFYVFML